LLNADNQKLVKRFVGLLKSGAKVCFYRAKPKLQGGKKSKKR
jgi:hypothetical protein